MYRSIMLAAVSATIALTPALAQDSVAAPVAAKAVKEKRVCRRDLSIGSNIPHSTCHLASEWAQIDAANRNSAQTELATARQSGR